MEAAVDLTWIPLGAGGEVVRWSGRVYEAITAAVEHRSRLALYHTALEVTVGGHRSVIESAPIRDAHGWERGVVAEGPVGTSWAGHLRVFRYEIRCWRGGAIPDAAEAVGSPIRVTDDPGHAQRVLELVPSVPTPTWGRDELDTGDMWNSNSLVSWLLERAGVSTQELCPPPGGRAPGWDAGIVVARRQMCGRSSDPVDGLRPGRRDVVGWHVAEPPTTARLHTDDASRFEQHRGLRS
jgi:hypothetical protein